MGRPLNKKYFANTNANPIGGEGVASVTIGGTWAGFTAATTTVTFSAPQLPGGVTATGTAVIDGTGAVTGVTITNAGSGYTSAPSVTIVDSDGGSETTGTATAVLTSSQLNGITVYAQTTSGGSNKIGDIEKQTGSTTFRVTTADGTAKCTLVTDGNANAEGEMTITAYDSAGGEYWVKKISNHRCTVVVKGVGGGSQFATNSSVPWSFDAAVQDVSVQVANN